MAVPEFLTAFVDDAAIFPPASTELEQAVTEHLDHRSSAYADLVGGFVVSDVKVADLAKVVSRARPSVAVNLVVTGGAGAIEPAVTWVRRSEGLSLRALEFALRDEEDLAHNAQRLVQRRGLARGPARRRHGLRRAAQSREGVRRTAGSRRSTSSRLGRSP